MRKDDHLSALPPGARLNSYTITATLGAGGFGITYKAREDITGREVAIKEYLPTAFAIRDRDGTTVRPLSDGAAQDFTWGLDSFRQEAKLLIDFRHPNIVPVLAYFEANGTGYLVMTFQEGASLGDILEGRGILSEAETVRLVVPLLDGVEEVHRRGFLHRDIKPDNVFVRTDGAPVLLDFGAARQALGEHSKNFTTLLTEGYAPFEQYAGSGNQGPWSDVYALAAVMFRCLMGKAPIEAPRRAVATLRGQPDPLAAELAALRNRISPGIAFAIEAGLRVVERERPSSVGAFRDLIVRPDMASRAALAAAAPSPFSTATLIPDGALRATSRYPRDTIRRERPRRRMATYVGVGAVLVAAAGAAALMGDHSSWLPDFFRRAGTEPATATTIPAGPKTGRDPDSAQPPPERAPEEKAATPDAATPNDDSLKGFAEHQRRQLDQVEAERRQWEAQKSTEAERKRLEDETAKKEAERKQQQEERDRKAEEDKARAEEERRARVEQENRRQDQDRAREAEERVRRAPDPPARTGRDPQRQAIPGPPDLPDPRRAGQRPGPPNTAPGDGAIRTPPAMRPPSPGAQRPPGDDEY